MEDINPVMQGPGRLPIHPNALIPALVSVVALGDVEGADVVGVELQVG